MASTFTSAIVRLTGHVAAGALSAPSVLLCVLQYDQFFTDKKGNIYNILWVLVFGFATLNILGLIARRFEPRRRSSLNLGEILAITVVIVAVILLTWEMLYLFHVLPLKLGGRG
jgi:hypothetical protein